MSQPSLNLEQSPILIVDDNPANVSLLDDLLYDAGYSNVYSLNDPREVLPFVIENNIDLLLLDFRMPYMSGVDVMQALRHYYETQGDIGAMPPVIILTAQTDEETRQAALQNGARDFLAKPFSHWEVELRIRNQLEARHYFNEHRSRTQWLQEEVHKRTQEVHHTQLEIAHRLARAGEYRDNETGMHVMRMSRMCQRLAQLAGYDEHFCDLLLYASPLHDLGKIGISDTILLKPGKLTDEEFAIMRNHAQIGYNILCDHPSPLLQMAAEIALTHHEKWDGSGYPNQLKGEEIPVSGRISAICDVFDALSSSRPYKPAWSEERAIGLLKEQAGKHFDPHLIDIFLDHIPEMQKIRSSYQDQEEH